MFTLNRPLPRPPEAVIPGTPFGIEMLKVFFLFGSVWSLMGLIPGFSSVLSAHSAVVVHHSHLVWLRSVGYAALFGVGFYGVHRRMRGAWRVGWFYLAFFYLVTIVPTVISIVKLPTPDRWTESGVVVVGFSAVAVYWGNWWNGQKRYFIPRP